MLSNGEGGEREAHERYAALVRRLVPRTFVDLARLPISLPLTFVDLYEQRDHLPRAVQRILRIGLVLGALAWLVILAGPVNLLITKIDWPHVWRAFEPFWAQLLGIVVIVACALGLYRLRTYRPKPYAMLEGSVAVISGWMAFSASTATERGLKLAAAVYLMVRSIDNWNREPKTRTAG